MIMSPRGRGFISWRYSFVPWIAAILLAAAMVAVAYYIFLSWEADTYGRAIGGALIEFGLIVILGAGFSQLLQASTTWQGRDP
jgi:H+/gluconate symporter-like permease